MAASAPGAEEPVRPIIVKKITIQAAGHHGGAWKVAYADFVTAMMAFFLLMWLLGATTEKQRKGIADYFSPTLVKTRQQTAGSDGLLGGSSLTDADAYPHAMGQTGTKSMTVPRDAKGGPKEGGVKQKEQAENRAKTISEKIKEGLEKAKQLRRLSRQISVTMTKEGIRIDLVDNADFSMFALGTTVLAPQARELMKVIASAIKDDPSHIIIRGHTDSLKWKPGVQTNNWSLSTGRAEATRQELVLNGIVQSRYHRIEGVADREHLVGDDPADPRNRRISILLVGD